jgi:hypothetical protein
LNDETIVERSIRDRSFIEARFKFGDSVKGFLSQCPSFTGDFDLSCTLDVWHATVKRGDQLVQMTELARSINDFSLGGIRNDDLANARRRSLEALTDDTVL